jgi:hypothetical protein
MRTRRLSALLLVLAALLPGQSHAQGVSLEYAVKATYLYKFAPFIGWPAGAFADAAAPVSICIVGNDPFGPIADRAVAGQTIDDRRIQIHRLPVVEGDPGCQVMYIGGSPEQSVGAALDLLKGRPTLTITDSARDSQAKGMVHFILRDNKVRFEIDDQAAADSGIVISSKVLSLATAVKPRRGR